MKNILRIVKAMFLVPTAFLIGVVIAVAMIFEPVKNNEWGEG